MNDFGSIGLNVSNSSLGGYGAEAGRDGVGFSVSNVDNSTRESKN